MFRNRSLVAVLTLVVSLSMVLTACAPPTPEKIVETVVVTKEVEKPVEVTKEVVITPTPAPTIDEMLETVGVKALDDYTVQFTLEHAAGYFPMIAGMWVARPMPQWNIEEKGDRWTESGLMVSNGPYVLKEWAHGAHLTFVKNPFWPDWGKPRMGNIEVIQGPVIMEESTEMAMYEAGEIDYTGDPGWNPPLPDMDRIKADPVLSKEFKIAPFLCTYYYGFVNTKPPFKDNPLLRKAFAAAIDRKSLVENVTKGEQKPAHTFVCPGIFGNSADDMTIAPYLLDYEEGLKKAKEWIAQAGYPEGEGLDLVLMHNVSEAHAIIAQAIQAMWKEAFPKAKITIETQEWKVYLKTLLPDAPDEEKPNIYRIGWCADYPDANNWLNEVFNPKSSQNYAKYNNPKFTELIEKAEVEQDPEVRKKLYNEAERIFIDEDMGIAPIYYYTRPTLTKPYLTYRPLQPGGGGDPAWLWTLDWDAKKAIKPELEKITLDMIWGTEPPTFDPSLATDTTSVWGDELLFLGLTGFDVDGVTTIPELATKWDVSADGLVYTFHLRNDVKWVRYNPATDQVEEVLDEAGNPRMVTAHDVVYGVKRTIDPRTASDYAYVLYIIKNAEAVNTMEVP